jgi:hypothetical protein
MLKSAHEQASMIGKYSTANADSLSLFWPPDRWLRVFHPTVSGHNAIKEAVLEEIITVDGLDVLE